MRILQISDCLRKLKKQRDDQTGFNESEGLRPSEPTNTAGWKTEHNKRSKENEKETEVFTKRRKK